MTATEAKRAVPMRDATPARGLFVIIPDVLSDICRKGEVTPRYYNPGDLFDEVHLILVNGDRPDPAQVQPMVGRAKLVLHTYGPENPRALFIRSFGWRPRLLRSWASGAVELAKQIRPNLIRCHGNDLNAFLAFEIKRQLSIPYVISLHGNPDVDYFRGRLAVDWRKRLAGQAIECVETLTVQNADMVLPVYSPILPYLRSKGVQRIGLIYNVVGHNVVPKLSYGLDKNHVRALCVGRQEPMQKDQTPIIEAVAGMPNVTLTLIGSGQMHEILKERARELGLGERVTFIPAMSNRELMKLLPGFDIYVYASMNYEISKTCMEAALAGLPIILNDRRGEPASELVGPHFRLVSGDSESYSKALTELIDDDAAREALGRAARRRALAEWSPEVNENNYVNVYRNLIGDA